MFSLKSGVILKVNGFLLPTDDYAFLVSSLLFLVIPAIQTLTDIVHSAILNFAYWLLLIAYWPIFVKIYRIGNDSSPGAGVRRLVYLA